jgi:predicted glycoside hydrolase/deacetylase ChbG (UPF0249 family)
MKKLIVNADDLGLSPEVNAGIFHAHAQGVVTATTCLVTLEGFDDAVAGLLRHPDLDPGVHLNLTWGRPAAASPLPRLAPKGLFLGKRRLALALALRRIPEEEIQAELVAQLDRYEAHLGAPSHVDVHQHFHVFGAVWRPLEGLVRDRRIPFLRIPAEKTGGGLFIRHVGRTFRHRPRPAPPPRSTDHFRGLALPGRLETPDLIRIARDLLPGLTELMVHPGGGEVTLYPDRLGHARHREREALTSSAVRSALHEAGVRLTSFRAET